jgi:phenylacetate-CoA ligase
VPYYKELLKNQFISRNELNELNWKRTRELLQYAYDHVPYYQNRFSAIGLHPKDIKNPEDYIHVPVLTRLDLQENFKDLVSKEANISGLRLSTTGGSTGHPVKVYHQKNVVRAAAGWRMLSWWGLPPGIDFASVYRDTRTDWRARLISNLLWWPTKRIDLNAADLTPEKMSKFIKEFNRERPSLLHGYVGAIDHLAEFIKDESFEILPPEAIWVTSSPLTNIQRKRIESSFEAPVYDQYGCCEIYWLAAQCPQKEHLHSFSDIRKFEFLSDDNLPVEEGQEGKIVVTDLENRHFPLIRYLNGDIGKALPGICSCGVTLPLMSSVKGRVSDIIKLPGGKSISGEYMTTIFDHAPDMVKQFQVIQRKEYSIDILVVVNEDYPNLADALIAVEKNMKDEVNGTVPVSICPMRNISQKGGKISFIKSELTQ